MLLNIQSLENFIYMCPCPQHFLTSISNMSIRPFLFVFEFFVWYSYSKISRVQESYCFCPIPENFVCRKFWNLWKTDLWSNMTFYSWIIHLQPQKHSIRFSVWTLKCQWSPDMIICDFVLISKFLSWVQQYEFYYEWGFEIWK